MSGFAGASHIYLTEGEIPAGQISSHGVLILDFLSGIFANRSAQRASVLGVVSLPTAGSVNALDSTRRYYLACARPR